MHILYYANIIIEKNNAKNIYNIMCKLKYVHLIYAR